MRMWVGKEKWDRVEGCIVKPHTTLFPLNEEEEEKDEGKLGGDAHPRWQQAVR